MVRRGACARVVVALLASHCSRSGFESTFVNPGDGAGGAGSGGDLGPTGDPDPSGDPTPSGDPSALLEPPGLLPVERTVGDDPLAPTLAWTPVAGASGYDVAVSSSLDCTGDVLARNDLTATSYAVTPADGLALGTTYYWCARSRAAGSGSVWAGPLRLGVYPWRIRALPREAQPTSWMWATLAAPDGTPGVLQVPDARLSMRGELLEYAWRLDPDTDRWSVRSATNGTADPWLVRAIAAVASDPSRGRLMALLDPSKQAATANEPLSFAVFDLATDAWSELVLDAASDPAPATCAGGDMVIEPGIDLALVVPWFCDPAEPTELELDLSVDPPRLTAVTANPARPEPLGRLAIDPASSQILFLPDNRGTRMAVYDPASDAWSQVTGFPPNMIALVSPDAGALLSVGYQTLARWDAGTGDWQALPATGGIPLARGRAAAARFSEGTESLTFAAVELASPKSGLAALSIQPSDRPTLALRDPASGSLSGTESDTVDLLIADDVDAAGWLVEETGAPPSSDDPRWQTARPTQHGFADTSDGLKAVSLWTRYPDGTTSRFPARASIWLQTVVPQAPMVTLRDAGTEGDSGPIPGDASETLSGCVFAEVGTSLAGLTGLLLSQDPSQPAPSDFAAAATFPLTTTCLAGAHGTATVYAWSLDAAGHVSAMASDDIFFPDVTAPTVTLQTANAFVTTSAPITWAGADATPPITYDVRFSSALGCAGDIDSVNGQTATTYAVPGSLVPQTDYYVCVRGTDSWTTPNTSDYAETRVRYQATPARWYALAAGPIANSGATGVAYDRTRGRMLLFGGHAGSYHRDVYAYDSAANTWAPTPLVTSGAPPAPRALARAFWDPASDRLIVFGGSTSEGSTTTYYDDTRALDLATNLWSDLAPAGAPDGCAPATAHYAPAYGLWAIGPGPAETSGTITPMLFDPVLETWSNASGLLFDLSSSAGALLENASDFRTVIATWVSTYDPATGQITRQAYVGGERVAPTNATRDDGTGFIVQYEPWCGSPAQQTRRTTVIDPATGIRYRTDADNIDDRCDPGVIFDPERRSVLLVMGTIEAGASPVATNALHELRVNGGPRLFASDPATGDEQTMTGDVANLAIDWDETAVEWLVNETAWPPPDSADGSWVAARPTTYTFTDSSPGPRTLYVWIRGATGGIVYDAGRWTITRQ